MKEMAEPRLRARSWETPSLCSVFLRKAGQLWKLELDSLQFCSDVHSVAVPALMSLWPGSWSLSPLLPCALLG